MSTVDRIRRILRARRSAKTRSADPVTELERAHAARAERLDGARRAVADLAAGRRRVEVLAERTRREIEHHDTQAQAAVAAGDERAAREYLRRSVETGRRLDELTEQHRRLDDQLQGLERRLTSLEDETEDSFVRFQSLRTDHDAARAALGRREDAVAQGQADALGVEREAEREIRQLRARTEAYEEIAGTDPGSDPVREAFDELGTDDDVGRRLDEMRRRIDPPA